MAEQTSPSPDATETTATSKSATSKSATSKAAQTDPAPTAAQPELSPDEIEAEIATTRAHLASTIDELTIRTQPREIVRRRKESARASFVDATHTPDGDLRVERIGAIAAAGAAVLLVLAILHRRHHRG